MNEQFTENTLITYANTLYASIASSAMPAAEKYNILQRLQVLTAEIIKGEASIPKARKTELLSCLEDLRKTIDRYPQRTLYPVKQWSNDPNQYDMVPAFDDIVHQNNVEETINEVRFVIEQMKNIPRENKVEYLTNIAAIENVYQNTVNKAKKSNQVVHSSIVAKTIRLLEAVYYKATYLNNNGEAVEMGGLVGLILKGIKAISGK